MRMPARANRSMLFAMSHCVTGRPALAAALFVPLVLATAPAARVSAGQDLSAGTTTLRFRALSSDGTPAPDLKAGDVTLRIEGKPREIQSLQFVDLRGGASAPAEAAAPAAAKAPVPPPYATNVVAAASGGGRDLYLLVDEESVAPGREAPVKEALKHLLGALSSRDRASLVSVRQGGPNVGLSTDTATLLQGIEKLGGYANTRESSEDLTCRTVRTVQMLQSVLEGSSGQGLPTIVFFSTQIASLEAGRTGTMSRDGKTRVEDLCQLRTEHFQRLGAAASNANATFYSVELLESSAMQPLANSVGGLDNLAGSMGGETVRMGANVTEQMSRIANATGGYYIAMFAADPSDRSGSKRVEISVARGGVSVRAPRELVPPRADTKSAAATPRDMIRSPSQFTDVSLRAAAFASRNPGDDKVRVLALMEPIDPSTKLRSAMVGLYDASGKLTAQWTAQAQDLSNPTIVAALLVPTGTYRLRAAATDASGKSGAVDVNAFHATLIESGSIKLGDLVLGKSSGTSLTPSLQFTTESEAIAMLELYGRPTSPLKMYIEVVDAPGEPIQLPLTPSATSEQDRFLLSAKLPIAALPAGDFLVRAVVGVEGEKDATITTTLRKVKTGS